MPRGKAPISGIVFSSSLANFTDDDRNMILDIVVKNRSKNLPETTDEELQECWSLIGEYTARYRGQVIAGLPPTETALREDIRKITVWANFAHTL
jgi:hypothetical protein